MALTKAKFGVISSALASGNATDGYVLTADGSGNSAWEEAAGGVAGISSSADATAITIDSSENVQFAGNVGIGVAPTHNFNQQAAGAVEARFRSTDNDCYLQISSDTDEGQDSVLQFLSGTTTRGSIIYDHNTSQGSQNMIFKTGDNTKSVMTLTGGGDFSFNLGTGDTGNRYMIINSGARNDGGILLKRENTSKWQINNTTSDDDLTFYSYGTSSNVLTLDRSTGNVFIRTTSATTDGGQLQLTSSGDLYSMYVSNTGFASVGSIKACERGATSAYSFAQWYSGRRPDTGGGDREFNFRGDGNAYADGSFNNSGADYAEYFESHTGSAIPRGTSVVLENNKVRAATSEDNVADIIGVVRPKEFGKNSMVIGNTAWNMWSEKYLTDDFNCYVMEDYSVVSWYEYRGEDNDERIFVTYESDNIPSDVIVPDDAETNTHDENGVKFQRRALNPDFDGSLTYEPREERDEWVIVGLIGQVQILDGQPTNDRWIKMRDISDTVEEWYIR